MRRLHVDYGECLIRLENSGKAVFRGNKTVMARRRFSNLSLCHHLYLFVRHASLTGRPASLPGRAPPPPPPGPPRPRQNYKTFLINGHPARPPPGRGAGRPGSGNFSNAFFIRGTTADRHSPYEQAGRTIREGAKLQTKERAVPPPCMSGQDDTGLFCRRSLPFAGLIDSLLLRRACLLCKRRIQREAVCQPWHLGCAYH